MFQFPAHRSFAASKSNRLQGTGVEKRLRLERTNRNPVIHAARVVALGGALGAVGCHGQVDVPGPEWERQRAYLLALTVERQETLLWAIDVRAGGPIVGPELSTRGASRLVAIHFDCSLASLGLPPGRVALRGDVADDVPLPKALGVQSLRVVDGAASAWQTIESVPAEVTEALRRLPIDDAVTPCTGRAPTLTAELIPSLAARGPATFGLPLRSDRFLIGTALDTLLLFDGRGRPFAVEGPSGGPFIAAYEGFDDNLYLLARDGKLAFGPLGGPWRIATSSVPFVRQETVNDDRVPAPIAFGALAGPDTPDAPLELYAAGDDRTLARWDGDRWVDLSVADRPDPTRIPVRRPLLAWRGPGSVVATGVADAEGDLLWVDGDDRAVTRLGDGTDDPVFLEAEPDGRMLLGTFAGRVYGQPEADQTFAVIGRTGRFAAQPIISFGDGLIVGSTARNLTAFQWYQLAGGVACPITPANLPLIVAVWPVGDGEWLAFTQPQLLVEAPDFGTLMLRFDPGPGSVCAGGTISL